MILSEIERLKQHTYRRNHNLLFHVCNVNMSNIGGLAIDYSIIYVLRKEIGLSQAELCEGICSRSMISHIETGRAQPSIDILKSLCARLGISLIDVVTIAVENDSSSDLQKILNDIQELYYLKEYTSVIKYADLAISRKINKENISLLLDCLIYKGHSLFNLNRYLESKGQFQFGLEMALKNNFLKYQILCQNGLGTCCFVLGQIDKARDYYTENYRLLQKVSLDTPNTIKIMYNFGNLLYAEKEYVKSKKIFQEALDLTLKNQTYYLAGDIYNYLGLLRFKKNEYKEAKEYFQRAYHFNEFIGNKREIAGTLLNMAKVSFYMNEEERGSNYIKQALSIIHLDTPDLIEVTEKILNELGKSMKEYPLDT